MMPYIYADWRVFDRMEDFILPLLFFFMYFSVGNIPIYNYLYSSIAIYIMFQNKQKYSFAFFFPVS